MILIDQTWFETSLIVISDWNKSASVLFYSKVFYFSTELSQIRGELREVLEHIFAQASITFFIDVNV